MAISKASATASDSTPTLADRWLLEDRLIAVAVGDLHFGATFVPHLVPEDYPEFRGQFRPPGIAQGHKPLIPAHVLGRKTEHSHLDLCGFLGGRGREDIWLGELREAMAERRVRPIYIQFRRFGIAVGFIPAAWKGATLPDRIAVHGLTHCGRVEIHKPINDDRNLNFYDTVVCWSELAKQV